MKNTCTRSVFTCAALLILASVITIGAPHPEMLVSTEWLAANIDRPNLVLIHVAGDCKIYHEGHIPGARFMPLRDVVVTRNGLPNELPPVPDLVNVFERLGVGPDTRIVVYTDSPGPYAARVFFTLDYLGLGDRTALLDGGLEKWRAEKRALSQTDPPPAKGPVEAKVRADAVIDLEQLKRSLTSGDVVVLDSRGKVDYEGTAPNDAAKRKGHIAGARNLFWRDMLNGNVLRTPAELTELLHAAGLTCGKTAVVYCNTGMSAAFNYFVLRYLGHPVRLYDGSLSEWSAAADAPMENGAASGN